MFGVAPLEVRPAAQDPCLIVYSSGTTGWPKGVVHTHHNLAASLFAIGLTLSAGDFTDAEAIAAVAPITHGKLPPHPPRSPRILEINNITTISRDLVETARGGTAPNRGTVLLAQRVGAGMLSKVVSWCSWALQGRSPHSCSGCCR